MSDQISGLNHLNRATPEKPLDPLPQPARMAAAYPKAVDGPGGKPAPAAEKSQPEPKETAGLASMANVRLEFRVDEKTNAVTVVIFDKATDHVVRTIPQEEMKNLRNGDLVQVGA
jgi:hypothetical protein